MWFGMWWWYSKQWTEYNIENNMWNNKKIYVFNELWCSMSYATVHNNILTLISATFERKNTKNTINYIFCLKLLIEIHTGIMHKCYCNFQLKNELAASVQIYILSMNGKTTAWHDDQFDSLFTNNFHFETIQLKIRNWSISIITKTVLNWKQLKTWCAATNVVDVCRRIL